MFRTIRGLYEHSVNNKYQKELENVLDYFHNHRHRMNYAELSKQEIVEAANKTHVSERLKKSSMLWGMEVGQAVLTFCSLVKSNRFDSAWERIMVGIDRRKPDIDNRERYGLAMAV